MRVGETLLHLARAEGARTIFVVGTGKGVGKTTALRAIYEAATRSGLRVALAAVGPTPPLRLHAGTLYATARSILARSPASELLEISATATPSGALLYARCTQAGVHELTGPATAFELSSAFARLGERSDIVLVDGAIDRIAPLAGSDGAIVVACGAAAARTLPEAVNEIAGLSARLRVPALDPHRESVALEGALTAERAAALIAAGERRQVVVRDATQILLGGVAAQRTLARLDVRCRRPLRVIAATVCALAPERSFDPSAFLREVASATALPTFDVFAGRAA